MLPIEPQPETTRLIYHVSNKSVKVVAEIWQEEVARKVRSMGCTYLLVCIYVEARVLGVW